MLDVKTDFESGNIGAWSFAGPRCLRFEAPMDGAPWAMWFYFRLEGASAGAFQFVLSNLHQCLEPTHWEDARPVMRPVGGDWQRASEDQVEFDLQAGEFRFHFDLPGGPVEVAYSYPYPPAMLASLVQELQQFPGVNTQMLGTSTAGRLMPYIVLSCTDPNVSPEVIWAIGREHAGEVSGSYVLDGFLRAMVASALRQRFELHCLPMVDIDGVAEGRYGKDAPPADHDMCWAPDSPRKENLLAMQAMQESARGGQRIRLLLNFHSPSPENESYLVPLNPTLLDASQRERTEQLFNALAGSSPAEYPYLADEAIFQKTVSWFGDEVEFRPEAYILSQYGADSCLLETAYFASPAGTPFTPQRGRTLGASLAHGLEKYLSGLSHGKIPVYDSLPPVYHKTEGWILWSYPQFVRLRFLPNHVLANGDDPSANVSFGASRLYRPEEVSQVEIRFRPGGEARLIWTFYDERGARLFAGRVEQPLSPQPGGQRLSPPPELPPGAALLRPNFKLNGSFRKFEVELG